MIAIQHKRSVLPIVILIGCLLTGKGWAQTPQIKVFARAQQNQILLKWAPTNHQSWFKLNQHGYKLERTTIARDKTPLAQPITIQLNPQALRPAVDSVWATYATSADSAVYGVLRGTLYGSVDTSPTSGDSLTIVNEPNVNTDEQRFNLALLTAEMKFAAAKLAALAWTDATALPNEQYTYRVSSLVPAGEMVIDAGELTIGIENYTPLPKPPLPIAVFRDRLVNLKWNADSLKTIFNAYWVERSLNNQQFKRLNSLPLVNLIDDGTNKYLYYNDQDTTLQNSITYYYRLVGKTPFDEEVLSDVIAGQCIDLRKPSLRIKSAKMTGSSSVELEWDYYSPLNLNIQPTWVTKYKIKQSGTADGYYRIAKDNIPITSSKETINDVTSSQYFIVTAITAKGDSVSSYPVLIQPSDTLPPAIPTGLYLFKMQTDSVFTMKWNTNTELDFLGYHVFRSFRPNEEPSRITGDPLTLAQLTDTLNLRMLNQDVYYYVVSLDRRYNQSSLSEP